MTLEEIRREKLAANCLWKVLSTEERFAIGDQLVLEGTFDWREFGLDSPPTSTFLNELDKIRMLWES